MRGLTTLVKEILRMTLQRDDTVKPILAAVDAEGWMPLHCAAIGGFSEVAADLVHSTPDMVELIQATTFTQQWSVLHCAAQGGSGPVTETVLGYMSTQLEEERFKEFLHAKDAKGWTPLHHAVELGNLQVVQYLLSYGASVSLDEGARAQQVVPYLHLALERSRFEVANVLLEYGASLEEFDSQGRLPIHVAAMKGQLPYVSHFVDKGKVPVDAKTKTTPAWTPLEVACRHRSGDVVDFLSKLAPAECEIEAQFAAKIEALNKLHKERSSVCGAEDKKPIRLQKDRAHKCAYPDLMEHVVMVENPDSSDAKLLEACALLRAELDTQRDRTGLPVTLLGLDSEWNAPWHQRSTTIASKSALLQLCSGKVCAVFRLCNHSALWSSETVEMAYQAFPPALRNILEDESIMKVGVGVLGDQEKIRKDYGVWAGHILDSACCLTTLLPAVGNHVTRGKRTSLRLLTKYFNDRDLTKNRVLTLGEWGRRFERLTQEEIEYASDDARASYDITSSILQRAYGLTKEETPSAEVMADGKWTRELLRSCWFEQQCRGLWDRY